MIEKFFDDVVEQTYYQTGNTKRNIVLASYNNDFSVTYLKEECYSETGSNIFFKCIEMQYGVAVEAYAPFLDTICDMFRELGQGKFEDFLDQCGIYSFHKEILSSYYPFSLTM